MVLRKVISSVTVLFSIALLLITGTGPVFAAKAGSGGDGLRISPVRSDLTIKPGASDTVDVYVTNLTDASADLKAVIDDFTAGNDESGTPNILLNGEKAPTHSLKGYVAPLGNFTLASKATKDLKVTITIPSGTPGGGYFGVVRVLPASTNSNKNVNLSASVGSLLLVTVPGKYKEQMTIASLDVRRMNTDTKTLENPSVLFTSNKNLYGVVRFQNSGDIQEEPFGKILLKKGSKTIGTYEINNVTPKGNVLPDSIRRFPVQLKGLGSIGKYTIQGNFGYGTNGQLLSASTSFYIIPVYLLVILAILLLLIILAIFMVPRMIRKYNRGVVNRAARNARR